MKKSLGPQTIVFPTPVFLVGSYDADAKPNIMTVAWGGICCSSPPCVAVSLRKATYSYGNIMAQKCFTISIPTEEQVVRADYAGIATGKKENKFEKTGFTAVKADNVNAPYVLECPLILECKVLHVTEIGLHTQFIGEILDVKMDEEVAGEKNLPEMDKVKPILWAPGVGKYYGIGSYLGKAFSIGREIKS